MSRGWVGVNVVLVGLVVALACGGASGTTEESNEKPPAQAVNLVADQSLRDASLEGQFDLVVSAVDQGARIDAQDPDGRTALMYAAFNGHTECAGWLLENGAAVGARENLGRTALMFASTGPFPETVRLLLELGSNPHDADEYEGWTPLMFAAGEGQLEVVRVLLENGANPSAKDKDGDVAADHAANNRHPEVESVLREAMQ